MSKLIDQSVIVKAEGNKPKQIEEYAGRVSTGHQNV
jgi:hypothetical protein